jgi:hypothetical protein
MLMFFLVIGHENHGTWFNVTVSLEFSFFGPC